MVLSYTGKLKLALYQRIHEGQGFREHLQRSAQGNRQLRYRYRLSCVVAHPCCVSMTTALRTSPFMTEWTAFAQIAKSQT